MRHDYLQPALLTAAAIGAGTMGWSGQALLLPIVLVFPMLWSLARSRLVAAIVSSGYFLAASRGLPQGVANFYSSDFWPGLALWLCASTSFVIVHVVLWTRQANARPVRYLAAAVLMAVPPFGITGWAHPITAAGILFPGWGWWGLAAMTAGLAGLVTRFRPAVAIALGGFWAWSAASWTDAPVPDKWRGVDLELGASLGRDLSLQRHRDLIATVKTAAADGTTSVALPESALGFWTSTTARVWTAGLRDTRISIVAGAVVVNTGGYDNVLIHLTGDGGEVIYRERVPVPGSMWQPWRWWLGEPEGAGAHFFANPIVSVGAERVAPLICYEQLLVWPILQSMLYDPDLIVAVGNGWWTKGTSIAEIQHASTVAWAKLFAKPLVFSVNT
ncbi:conjugal transfer protein TraB [Rhizobium multihospitium]|uniref:Carbon-nitrogen hydrolase n=1 Tax=Rhizobium multihospitium TaxID=410764 RepID=A0A1C3XBL3_9HYPH|nr:conjugal transfer protein TraB [Rhizobium multihospitium]SCB49555.1 Carbon-nitrogen hydrolase [Rhizobium multihospitium]